MTYKLKFINLVKLLSINSIQKWASLMALMVKNHLQCQETWVQFLGWEDSLDQGMASEVAQSCLTLCDPVDCSLQAPQSTEFSRQEY